MTDDRAPDREAAPEPRHEAKERRRWLTPLLLTILIVAPVVILIFSNLEATEVSWAGFRFNQPLWVVLLVTFGAGMAGGKVGGWAWRRWRKRRRRMKDEMEILRKHAADSDAD
jgi:uncharacterized integral membrane protein